MANEINEGDLIAVVRVRGIRNVKPKIRHTLSLMRLHKPNHGIVIKATKSAMGMLNVVKDYVAYGKISKETLIKLIHKRGELGSKRVKEIYKEEEIKAIAEEIAAKGKTDKVDPVFRLHPPRRGWKNIKMHYPRGALGRREDMDELIRRMM